MRSFPDEQNTKPSVPNFLASPRNIQISASPTRIIRRICHDEQLKIEAELDNSLCPQDGVGDR